MALQLKMWCRVVAMLRRDFIDVMLSDGSVVQFPIAAVPHELRCPNAEFWISWDDLHENMYVFLGVDDPDPVSQAPSPPDPAWIAVREQYPQLFGR